MAPDNPVLIRHAVEFCEELLRPNPIAVEERLVSTDDVRAHLAALTQHFQLALEGHQRQPSFSSSLVIATLAVLLHERAEVATRASEEYQELRRVLEKALEGALVPRGFGQVGNVNVHLGRTSRTIDDLKLFALSGQTMALGVPDTGGVVLISIYEDVYRFALLTHPTHTCAQPPTPLSAKRAVLAEVTESGRVSFTIGCGCVYVADGLEFDRP
jgi:hypothetical protein